MKKILVVDDNITICLMLRSWLIKHNYEVDTASSVADAIEKVKKDAYDLILSDIIMPEDDGFTLLKWIQKYDSDIIVIMMTSYADIESAVDSIKMGASDYISKPIEAEALFKKIDDAFRKRDIAKKAKGMQQYLLNPRDEESKKAHDFLIEIVRANSHILLMGQEGTGKTTAAKFIYIKGAQERGAYVEYDLTQSCVEIENMGGDEDEGSLFTHHLNKAKGGLLHIKNFRKTGIQFQTSLLRALTKQSKNSDYTQIVISTTYTQDEIKENFIPKLSERLLDSYLELSSIAGKSDEIRLYTEFFLEMANKELDKHIDKVNPEVYKVLYQQKWKANLQELKNIVFKLVLLSENNEISKDLIPYILNKGSLVVEPKTDNIGTLPLDSYKKENFERKKITEALDIAKGNKTLAATLLNIDRKTLYNKIRLYEIS